jgi:hypothetical protein
MLQKQSNTRRSGRAHNHQEQKSLGKSAFFDVEGIVHREFVPPNTTVNFDFYCDVMRRLRENMRRKRPELWGNHHWLLHHDNAPAQTSLKITEFVTNNLPTRRT